MWTDSWREWDFIFEEEYGKLTENNKILYSNYFLFFNELSSSSGYLQKWIDEIFSPSNFMEEMSLINRLIIINGAHKYIHEMKIREERNKQKALKK